MIGPRNRRGVVGHARSSDLIHWEALPPVSAPGDFGQLEVPQPVAIGGRYYLLFCTAATTHAADWQSRTGLAPVMGTHYLVADNPLGPYRLSTPRFLAGDAHGSLYAGKLVQAPGGGWVFLAFRNVDPAGNFYGELIDPHPGGGGPRRGVIPAAVGLRAALIITLTIQHPARNPTRIFC